MLYQTLSRIIKDYLYYFLANLGIQPIVKLYAITAIKCGRTRFYDQYQFKLELWNLCSEGKKKNSFACFFKLLILQQVFFLNRTTLIVAQCILKTYSNHLLQFLLYFWVIHIWKLTYKLFLISFRSSRIPFQTWV